MRKVWLWLVRLFCNKAKRNKAVVEKLQEHGYEFGIITQERRTNK